MSVVASEMFMFSVLLNTNQLRAIQTFQNPSPPPHEREHDGMLHVVNTHSQNV